MEILCIFDQLEDNLAYFLYQNKILLRNFWAKKWAKPKKLSTPYGTQVSYEKRVYRFHFPQSLQTWYHLQFRDEPIHQVEDLI